MNINLTDPKGIKLLTKDKLCEDNIKVFPKLQSKEVTANGTVTPDNGYAGLDNVTVNINIPTYSIYAGETEPYAGGLINFTVDGVTYQAEDGMTWEEWCSSDYCTDSTMQQSSGTVYAPSGKFLFERDGCTMADYGSGAEVDVSETIIANHAYYSMTGDF